MKKIGRKGKKYRKWISGIGSDTRRGIGYGNVKEFFCFLISGCVRCGAMDGRKIFI